MIYLFLTIRALCKIYKGPDSSFTSTKITIECKAPRFSVLAPGKYQCSNYTLFQLFCVQVSLSISYYPLMGYDCTVVLCNAGSDPRNTDHIHLWRWKAILILQKIEKLHLLLETKRSLKAKNLYTVLSKFIIKLAGGVQNWVLQSKTFYFLCNIFWIWKLS